MIAAWCYWVAMACSHTRWKSLHPQTNFFCVIDNILFDFWHTWKSSMHKSLAADWTNYLKTSATCSIIFIDYVWGLEYLEFCFDGKNIGTHKRAYRKTSECYHNKWFLKKRFSRNDICQIFYGLEMCQFPSDFAVLVSIKRENWDFLKRKKTFFSSTRFHTQRKSANSKRNLYCNKQREEKYLTRFEVDIANEKKGVNGERSEKPKAKNFLHWNVYLDEICLHSSFHIALNKLIPCFFPACLLCFTLIELFFFRRVGMEVVKEHTRAR